MSQRKYFEDLKWPIRCLFMAVSKGHINSDNRHTYVSTIILSRVQISCPWRMGRMYYRKRLPSFALALGGGDVTKNSRLLDGLFTGQ